MTVINEKMMNVAGFDIRVSIRGDGPPLLMFNGLGGHLELFEALRSCLTGYTTIAYDVPGMGKSAPHCRLLRMRHHARVAAALLDQLDIDTANIFGVSWGGQLAQEFTRRHPERVQRVILAATSPGPGLIMRPDVFLAFCNPKDRSSDTYIDKIAPKLFGGKMRANARQYMTSDMTPHLVDKSSFAYYQQMAACAGWTSLHFLRRITKPVLIIAADDDPLMRMYNAIIFSKLLTNSVLKVLKGEGHFFFVTSPEETAAHIMQFAGDSLSSPERNTLQVAMG